MIDASIPMAAGQAGAFDLAGMMREVQSQKMRQMQMDQAAEKQRQEQARNASLASMVGEYSRTGTLPTKGPAFDSYVQNAPEDAFKMLGELDKEKRAKVAAGVKDLAAAVQWADTPEKWQQVQKHYAQYDPQLASVPFEGREGALMQLGQMGSYLEQQNKQNEQYTLSPGAKRFDAKGNLVAEAAFAPHYGTVSEGETAYVSNPSNPWAGVATGIAQQFGLKPEEVAAVMSYETGGTFSPTIMGGKGGNYMGLIQFGPSERQKYGITNKSTPEQWTQAIGSFLTDRGFKPGMNILDFYSTINAGQPGRYNASDGPGNTVSKHVGNILSGRHIQNAKQWLGGSQVIAQGGPKQKEAPSGYRWKADGSLEPIPGGPAVAKAGGGGTLTKQQIGAARAKVNGLKAIEGQLARVEEAAKALESGGFAGPVWGRIPGAGSMDSESAAYDKAIAGLGSLVRQLTRTPGEGSMSDYESKLAQAILPSRTDNKAARDEAIAGIKELIANTRAGYEELLGGSVSGGSQQNDGGWGAAKVVQ